MIYSTELEADVELSVTPASTKATSVRTPAWQTIHDEYRLKHIVYDYAARTSLHGINSSIKRTYSLYRK